MPRDATRRERGYIFLPRARLAVSLKVTVKNETTGVETNVSDHVIGFIINWELGKLAFSSVRLSNPYGKWLNFWSGGETLKIYAEYGDSTPTTLLFNGKLDNPSFSFGTSGYITILEGRQTPELGDIKVVEQFDNATVSDAIKAIVDNNYSGIVTYTNVADSTVTFTGNFKHVSGIQAMNQLAQKADLDLYIDTDKDVHLFTKESRENNDEYITYEENLKSVQKYGKDNTKIFNNIIVYGKEDRNVIILKTEEDATSQSTLWRKDFVVTDSSLETLEEVQDKADIELSNKINISPEGIVNGLGMPDISPGDNIVINVPFCGITGFNNIVGLTHRFDSANGFNTDVQIKQKQRTINELFKERIDAEERLKPYKNLNNMRDSYPSFFNESPAITSLINCEIDSEDRLGLSSGELTGTCTFDIITADENVSQCELRIITNFPAHELSSFEATNDGGITYETITPGVVHTFTSTGNKVGYRINLVGDSTHDPIFEACVLLYK